MSRIGRAPVAIPSGVDLKIEKDQVIVKGPKGQLNVPVSPRLTLTVEDSVLSIARSSDHRNDRAQHGLARSLINNAIIGVKDGFVKNLEIRGVGYRCALKGSTLELSLGFSHPVTVDAPEGITIASSEPTKISVSGIDKQLVGQIAANIRAFRSPDSYHGKGVRYEGEQVRLKAGKASAR